MANSSRGRADQENVESGDDDFGDFGGFEVAEPVADLSASQAQPVDSPWAIFNTGNASGRPDLLCAQNRFPTYLDPSDISGTSQEPGNLEVINDNVPVQPSVDLFAQNSLDQARIAENVLDGTLLAVSGPGFHQNLNLVNGRLPDPDIGLGINENRLFGQVEVIGQLAAVNEANAVSGPGLPEEADAPDERDPLQVFGRRVEHENVQEPQPGPRMPQVDRPNHNSPLEENNVSQSALQEQLNSLTDRNQSLEAELAMCQEQLEAQRLRLQEVASRHRADLEEIRKGGHDALAVVVDQYKEQSRTVVLEQQELAQRNLVETLSQQMKVFQEMLQVQQEITERQREEDRQELGRKIERALEESRQQQQENFDAFLVAEQEKQRQAFEKAVEEERAASQEKIIQAVNAEQEKARARLEEIKVECSQKLEEDRKAHEEALHSLREEQQRLAQDKISQLVDEERERGRAAVREALNQSRLHTRAYIDEQRQADSRVRTRHLASLDLFLESSRQQISLLLESEKCQTSSSSSSDKGAGGDT
ncbi:unnamed protein product [Lymnaea stagnalis]|uniref:Uncharacterized protein n=1 Tax=Lymnaea stagnalis TaxID=6523 RepID=A0AAV2I3N5_LYMST